MSAQNPFELLGLALGAPEAEIKAAYRGLVRLYHPDNNPGFPDEAAAKLRELRDAYDQALAGWRPAPAPLAGWTAPAPAPGAAGKRGRRAKREAGPPPRPWTPPPPNKHDNPPRKMDPPKVPSKPQGPEPPEPKYAHVPPPRSAASLSDRPVDAAAEATRRAVLIDDLVAVGFVNHPDELALDHAIVDAFLPVLGGGERVRLAVRYASLAAAGTPPAVRHREVFLHPVPLGVDDEVVRAQVVAELVRAYFVVATDDRLLWTVSRFNDVEDVLLPERVDVHAESLESINRASLMQGGIGLGFGTGLAVRFQLGEDAATGLVAAVEAAGGGAGRQGS